jgi:hypothetical protein
MGPDAMRPYHPIFGDGDYEFHGVVTVAEFPGETFNAIIDVTLTEGQDCCSDRMIMRVEADNSDWNDPETGEPFPNTLLDEDGYRWLSGDILVTAYPVIYSAPYNPNDPYVAIFNLELDNADWVYNDEPNEDGSFSFKYCENHPVPNTAETGACDADYGDVLNYDVEIDDYEAVTAFGQSAIDYIDNWRLWFEDLYSGIEDDLRVDNRSPAAGAVTGYYDGCTLPHPANAIDDVEDFYRSESDDCEYYALGWVTWTDTISKAVIDPAYDDDEGIGMPADEDEDQPNLIYIVGPDADGIDTAEDIFEDADAVEFFNVVLGSDLTPETDSPGLEDAGSAEGTPLSDSEYDYYMTARHWDRFGNWVLADEDIADNVSFGVDGLAPRFTDEDGEDEDPVDPTTLTSVYNTYDDGYYFPCTWDMVDDFDFDCDYVGEIEFIDHDWYGDDEYGVYEGYATDTGNGFAGLEGLVMEDWEYTNGGVAEDSRFGYYLQDGSGILYWCYDYSCDFTIDAYAIFNNEDSEASYRDQKVHAFDRAGNQRIVDNVSEHIVDQDGPDVYEPSVPAGPIAFGETISITVNVEDNVDLKKTLGGFEFSSGPLDGLYDGDAGYIRYGSYVVNHSAFGSDSIISEAEVTLTMPLTPCAGAFFPPDVSGNDVWDTEDWFDYEETDYVSFETWDHSSPYGQTYYEDADISDAYDEDSSCFDEDDLIDELWDLVDDDLVIDLDTTADGAPVISFSGATSTFSTDLHPTDMVWYYQDIGGYPIPFETSASDWTLNVSDTGGDEIDARSYTYTYTGDLPTDKIEDGEDSEGFTDGFTFAWPVGGPNIMFWVNGWDV